MSNPQVTPSSRYEHPILRLRPAALPRTFLWRYGWSYNHAAMQVDIARPARDIATPPICRGPVVPKPAWTFAFLSVMVLNSPLLADDIEQGRPAYLQNCAPCHGNDGKGSGPGGVRLTIKPADLTTLARRNRGLYAPTAIYQTIDGRKALRPHRTSAMPIWGCRQAPAARKASKAEKARKLESLLDLSCDPESVIRRRIESIVRYLATIQVQ